MVGNGEYDPKFEITFLDKKLKSSFRNVGKDIGSFKGDLEDFKKFVTKELGKLLIADEHVSELLKHEKKIAELDADVSAISKQMQNVVQSKDVDAKFADISKQMSGMVDAKEYAEKIRQIEGTLSERHIRKTDIVTLERDVRNFRRDIEALRSSINTINTVKEDLIDFKKKALTRYNFDKLENWIKEIEKDVLILVSLKKKVDLLASVKEVDNMRRSFDRNTGEFVKLRKEFDAIKGLRNEFDTLQKNTKIQVSGLSKRAKDLDSGLGSIENSIEKLGSRIARIEKQGKKIKSDTRPAKKEKKSKKKKGNVFKRAIDWLLEDTD